MILIPTRTSPGMNSREHYMARARRVKSEKAVVAWQLAALKEKPALPCAVTLTRFAPSNGLDDDNLRGAMKSVRDAVADWLGVDDKHKDIVAYHYAQERATWAVGITFSTWSEP